MTEQSELENVFDIQEAYELGRADALKELTQGEPDGWVMEYPDGSLATQDDSSDVMLTDKKTAELYAKSYNGIFYPVKLIKMEVEGED